MDNKTFSRCLGVFQISHTFIENCPYVIKTVLSNVLVVKAEACFASNCIMYTAMSELFDPVPYGEQIPTYEIIITQTDQPLTSEYSLQNHQVTATYTKLNTNIQNKNINAHKIKNVQSKRMRKLICVPIGEHDV